uniref:Uncharacterized protein n=1 Tax=Triticum urartu TaxID=4572 RepID=A0A8R7VF35_TRIUA
ASTTRCPAPASTTRHPATSTTTRGPAPATTTRRPLHLAHSPPLPVPTWIRRGSTVAISGYTGFGDSRHRPVQVERGAAGCPCLLLRRPAAPRAQTRQQPRLQDPLDPGSSAAPSPQTLPPP